MKSILKSALWIALFAISFFYTLPVSYAEQAGKKEVESAIQKVFKNISLDSLTFNDELNMYEIVVEGQVFYITKDLKYAFLGHIFNITNPQQPVNLTMQKQMNITKELITKVDKRNALKIGNGPVEVIEVSNPNCPHCRNLSNYMKVKSNEVTRYIYFLGIEGDSKINYILCQPNAEQRIKAYEEVYLQNKPVSYSGSCDFAKQNLKEALSLKVQGVPVLFIKGQVVKGANIDLIESLIKTESNKENKQIKKGGVNGK